VLTILPRETERVNLTRPLPDPYLGLSSTELEDERARLQMLVLDSNDPRDRAYWQAQLDDLDGRIARYQAHGIRWPNRRRRDELVTFARELKAAVDLARFVEDELPRVALRRTGAHWTGHCPCPDHDDQTPSFVVYADGGWTCFGRCGRSGDIYTLVALCFGLERFADKVKVVADYIARAHP
jgi:hypothetical protein